MNINGQGGMYDIISIWCLAGQSTGQISEQPLSSNAMLILLEMLQMRIPHQWNL